MDENKTQRYRKRLQEMKNEVENESWLAHWKDISDFILPRHGRYLFTDKQNEQEGKKKNSKIINNTAGKALRIFASGMQSGMTSPSRPWFRISTEDKALMEYEPVKEWLHSVRDLMLAVYQRSNFYGSTYHIYKELGAFCTASMFIEEDLEQVIRCRPMTIGEYYLGLNSKYRVDKLYRQFSYTTEQMVEEFGEENVSSMVKDAYKNGDMKLRWEVVHCVQPNLEYRSGSKNPKNMLFESVYYEPKADPDKILRRGGYKDQPFVGLRWETTGTGTYGDGIGMSVLGDVKQLQKMEEDKLDALRKMVKPPMNAPSAMKGKGGTIIAGGVNYIDVQQGQQGFTPTLQVNPDLQNIAFEIDRVEQRIRNEYFNDLFLAVINEEKKMTAFEVAKRYEEKMIVLAPALEKSQNEFLDPVNARLFSIMYDLGMIPPMPKELENVPLKIEYTSLLSQAQKLVEVGAVEQTANFVGALAPIFPEIVDKFDADQAVDMYGEAVGVMPKIIRSDDVVAEIRAERQKQQQAAQMAAMAQPAKDATTAMKNMSETSMDENTALQQLMEGMRG